MTKNLIKDENYRDWFVELKTLVNSNQIKAKLSVNSQMIILYWQLGDEINKKINESDWGSKLIEQLSKDLKNEFPDIKGFSRANLYAIKKFNEFYSEFEFVQQAVGQLPDIKKRKHYARHNKNIH